MNWQPIETAPKDGTNIIITDGCGCYSVVSWANYWAIWLFPGYGDSDNEFYYPTHWMPLPEPPEVVALTFEVDVK